MWPAGRQLGALVWKNWLVRCRHRVLCLAEFLWPCVLFSILTALRFQEPPRHRDSCYLQPRDLPSRGVLPFVRGLLCNTGARCRNTSDAGPTEHRLRSSRFRATAAHHKIHDLVFLQEMQDLADGVREMMDKATNLKQLWAERAKAPGSPYGSSFLTVDLNKTEEVIAALESLQQQPQVWDFLLLLPGLDASQVPIDDGLRGAARLLQAVLNSLTSLEELGRPPLNPATSRVSRMVLKATISALTFLRGHGAAAAESGRSLSLRSLLRAPQEVRADLQSRFGFDDLHAEQILNYSADLKEIPTDSSLERMVCSALSRASEDEADGEGHPGDCHARWSAAKTYLVHAVSRLQVYKQVLHRWRAGGRLQQVLRSPLEGGSALQEAAEALQAGLLLLMGSATTEGPGSHAPPEAVLNSTKEHLMKEKKLDALGDEQLNFLLSFVEFLEKLLPNPFDSSIGPTETILNAGHSWINHLKNLGREPSGIDTQKLLEFGKEVIEKVHTLEKTESSYVLRLMETVLSEINPKLLELWTYDISKGKRTKFENLSTLSNFSVLENERILSKSFNFSKLFRSDWPESPAVKMDFVHLSESIIHSLYELGFLRQEQVSEALDTVYAVRNASDLFSALSEPQKQEVDKILTHIYLNVFKDPDSAFLLQVYSSFYQYTDKLLGIQSRESLLSFLTQTSKHIFEIIKQFNFQNISKAFAFLYETTELLGGISEVSYCQQLLSVFNLLELQAQSLMSAERPELEVIHATLTGLKQLLMGDEDFRISLFQYMNQLFNSSLGTLLGNECFALNNKITSMSHSVDGGPPLTLLWTQIHSNLSADGSVFGERMAVHCSISWLQKWAEIWGSTAQILQLDVNVFTPLHIGLTQLLGELESDVKISKSCQGIFPIHRPARLILNLLKNMTQGGGLHDRDDFRNLRELWGAVRDALVRVKLLHPDQVERSLSTLDTALSQLKAFPLSTRAGREFLYSVLDVLTQLSNTSDYRDRHTHLINHFLLNNLTDYEVNFESIITDLRETILFLRNVSHDHTLLSCADSFQNITEFILEDGLLHVNTSQRVLHILAMLNSFFSSEDIMSILKGCIEWADIFNHSYVAYDPSFPPDHLRSVLKHFSDVENKINSTLTLVTWLLNTVESGCSLNKSNINCMNIYLKNVTDFLNVILTAVFEKEKAPQFEILLTLLNNSTNQVSMLINNLTRDFEFASQFNWKHFTELILRPIEMSEEIPSQFQNTWLHLVDLGKEIQDLVKDIFPNILENNFSSEAEKFLNIFTTSPKEKDIHRLGNSFFHLTSYLVFNLSDDLQNLPQIIPHEIVKTVGLGIQLIRDVFNSLMPPVHHNIPGDPGNNNVLKKIASFLLTLKKTDIDLLVDQLEQGGESLMDFIRNISRSGTDSLGVKLLVGLMEKFVDGSHSWNVNHLLRLSRLIPREDMAAVVDLYSALPHAVRLLQRVVDKNITKALKDVYDFTVLHGIGISHVTKEDFMFVMKTLLDTIELISDKPGVLAKVVTCLPVVWCRNYTISGFQQNPELEACNGHFYSKVASILDHLHLPPPGEASQCSNESSRMEITKNMVCVIHELVDWSSVLLELSEVFHVKASLVKTVQLFRQKVFPSVLSGNQSMSSTSGLCPPGPMKQVALQIIEKFRNVSFTKATSDENILDKLALLNRILNNEGTEASLMNLPLSLGRMIKSLSGDESLENSTRSVVSLFMTFLDANIVGRHFEALSSFIKRSRTAYNFVDLWLESEQAMKDPNLNFNRRILFSKINEELPMINSMALQKMTVQLVHILESLNSSSLQSSEMTGGFPSVTKNWLRKYASEEYSRIIQIFFFLMANENSTLTGDINTFLDYLKNISRGGDSHVDLFAQLVNQEQSTNFSVARLLLKSFLVNSINNLAVGSRQAAWNLSDTDLQVLNLINLTLNQTPLEKGERILLPPGGMVEFMGQLLKTFFTFAEKENSENKTSLLPKDLHDIVAEMSFVKDKVLEILKVDQFLTSMKEKKLMSIFSSLKETIYHLIKGCFMSDHTDFYFDNYRGWTFLRDLFNALQSKTSVRNKTENNLEFLTQVSQLFFHMNSSANLSQLSHQLQAALHLVREASAEMAAVMDSLFNSPRKDLRASCPSLREAVLANLTDLLSFTSRSLPLRHRAAVDITARVLGVVSRAGGGGPVPEPRLEMPGALGVLVSARVEMRALAASLNSTVELLQLAKKVSRKMAAVFETHRVSGTDGTMRFFDALYAILQQKVGNAVNETTALEKVDQLVFENISDSLVPFLDLAFGMIGIKPNISQGSGVFNMSSSILSDVDQSREFSDVSEEIAEFLTSGEINLGDVEHLLVAINNGTEIFSMDSVNVWEEILDCLISINNITNQIDFLRPNPVSTHGFPQDAHEVTLVLDEMLSRDSTEIGPCLRMLTDLAVALWSPSEKDDLNVSSLWLPWAQRADALRKAVGTVVEFARGGHGRGASVLSSPLMRAVPPRPLEGAARSALRGAALLRKGLLLNNPQRVSSTKTVLQPGFEMFLHAAAGKNIPSEKGEKARRGRMAVPDSLTPPPWFQNCVKGLIALTESWQEVLADERNYSLSPLAGNPSVASDALCAARSCEPGGVRWLMASALRGVLVLHDLYQDLEKAWSAPRQLDCEGLRRNLSRTLEHFRSHLENAAAWDCACPPAWDWTPQRLHTLAQRLEQVLFPGNLMTSLSNFTATVDVKVKDLVKNITAFTEELRSAHLSAGTISSILEASISRSQVLSGALTVALSGRCDQDVLRLLLAFPEDGKAWLATRELCGLPGARVYSLLVSTSRHLDLRSFIYKTLMPAEAKGLLSSLLGVVSRLSHLLPRASHVLAYLPQFLHTPNITALLDLPDSLQASPRAPAESSAFGSFQAVVTTVCQEQESFLSNSNMFLNLPRVNELLESDKEKFNIPEDSTPFCLKLYQEILQSPNGALVWSFLKPVLHGKILYTPDTPAVKKVIRKANHTFVFVDKLRTLSKTLLSIASSSQSSGHGQMLGQLQEVLRNKFLRNFVESQLHINVDKLTEKLQTYAGGLGRMLSRLGAANLLSLGHSLVNLSSCVLLDRFQGLPSAAALEATAHGLMQHNSFLASVIFNSSSVRRRSGADAPPLPPRVAYTIRTSLLYSMRTDQGENPFWKFHPQSLPADSFKYNYVFAPLQDMLERALIRVQTGREAVGPAAQAQPIPYPCHSSDLFLNNVAFFLPLIMMLTWIVSVASMVRRLVHEREIQMEEYLRMMGVPPATGFLAWFLENAAVMALGSAALAVVLKTSGIFAHSNAFIVFLFLLDFGVSVVMLSYLLSACFRRAAPAALCGSLLYLASFLPYIVLLVLRGRLSAAAQMLLCLLSTTAFGQGVFFVTFLEGQEAGVQWGNLHQPPEQAGLALGWVCGMILVDSGLYFLCGWYLSNLVPGSVGVQKPWCFPFTASHWKGVATQRPGARGSGLFSLREDVGHTGSLPQLGKGEREGGAPGVTLVSVTKEYQPHQAAVQDLTLTFHRGQITALLGTNGAGKTTVLSLVTGLHAPTSGTVFVDGRNLQTDLAVVRKELGVCPQRDVLLDRLTVLEHLLLFASIRSPQRTRAERRQQVDKALRDVGLTQHQHKQARALSGGLRRKLSIGAAFLGTSRTVVLDEPTSGVDPCSRRSIWDILLQYREGRTIILTTHHLDEAEALSDRVAVLQQGRLRCCGPPLGLTEAYGQGLCLTLTQQPSAPELDGPQDAAHTTALIQTYVPQAFLRDRSGRTLSYALPKDADRTGFKGLFQALERNRHRLRLAGCGIADSTLEEVFLMLLPDPSEPSDMAPGTGLEAQHPRPPAPTPGSHYGAPASTLTQVAALLTQRLCRTRRAWRGALCDLLLPVLFVALAMSLFLVRPLATDYPALQLTPGRYGKAETSFFSSDSDGMELAHVLLRAFGDGEQLCASLAPGLTNASCWHPEPSPHPEAPGPCGCPSCPNASARAPSLTSRRGHRLLNLSALRPEEYLLAPGESPRLGGWSFGGRGPDPAQDENSHLSKPENLAKVWYSQKAFHALPSYLNHLSNLLLWRLLPPAEDWRQHGITLYSHPYGGALLNEDKILESIRQCGVALCIVLGVSVLAASIGSSVVRDRVTGAKRLQHLSGLGYGAYWFSNFLYDMLFYSVSVGLCVAVVAAFGLPAFTFRKNLAATILLLVLFGYATLPGMYLTSRLFPSADVAFIAYVSLNFVLGLCTLLMTTMPRLLAVVTRAQNLQTIYEVLKWVFTVFPQFCLGQGLIELCYNQIQFDLTHSLGVDSYASPFRMSFLGWVFVQLASQGTALLLLRLLLHGDVVRRARRRAAVQGTVTACADADVEAEQARVLTGRTGADLLVLCNLSKSYGRSRPAVRDVTLGLRSGECFGLLGVNGAGKSTTFRMLSGDEAPSAGHAVVRTPAGEDVPLFSAGAAGVRVGYCPQQDALDEPLTGWEHLRYYCRLRGIPGPLIPQVAGDLVRRLHLEAHVDKPVASYSGGTRRKLSVALALLGKPHLLLLDEPSSGMDPRSKRFLWKAIAEEVREGCAVVLTSHSMEECEALCTRLAIMVDGSFRCLGTPQHIKDRFGAGYTVRVWVSAGGSQRELSDRLQLRFPGARLKGQRPNVLEYQVPAGWAGLADLLQVLEDSKAAGSIRHYALAQASLEQVFVDFAAEQPAPPAPPDPPARGRQPQPLPV
ncbi:ATP-binding cassette sub-family A member 13 [Eptesicus fuscus]|uniref:ATP-binding cassette sub-family A member 13 n=1 Tax=Eptesicus fuscus TaxID=29078 RepID=UPI002403AE4D|nr:ATP-binding cassette sub-family A member 13 [Eptesicus fuscus]